MDSQDALVQALISEDKPLEAPHPLLDPVNWISSLLVSSLLAAGRAAPAAGSRAESSMAAPSGAPAPRSLPAASRAAPAERLTPMGTSPGYEVAQDWRAVDLANEATRLAATGRSSPYGSTAGDWVEYLGELRGHSFDTVRNARLVSGTHSPVSQSPNWWALRQIMGR
jgi:hypothetical protein